MFIPRRAAARFAHRGSGVPGGRLVHHLDGDDDALTLHQCIGPLFKVRERRAQLLAERYDVFAREHPVGSFF
jgi:hypothetical protein